MTGSGQPTPQQVPGVDGPPSPAKPRGISARTKITVALAAVGVVGGAAWAGSTLIERPTAPVAQVQLEPTSSAGSSPFMSPVGVDRSDLSPPAGSAGDFSGDTPGLFAENGDEPSCDAPALTADLSADPVKAAAWAEALGIRTEETAAYVATLTPVVLRSDTAVTSHGYENGSFSAYPAVLQAGTAVFINGHGEPRVKCFSGNPLTESTSPAQATYVGPGWGHFQPASVTVIHPAPIVIGNYVVIDVEHGRPASRPGKPPWTGEGGGNGNPGGGNPGGGNGAPTPNPALEAKAKEAAARAEQAAKDAAAARAIADDKQTAARIFATEARNLADADAAKLTELQEAGQAAGTARQARDAALAAALAAPTDAAKQAAFRLADTEFQKSLAVFAGKAKERAATSAAAAKAKAEAEEKANQAKFAEAAARSAEGTTKAAEDEAKKAKEAAEAAARGGRKNAARAVANEVTGDAGIAPGTAAQDGTPAEVDGQVTDPAAVVERAGQGTSGEPAPGRSEGEQPLDGVEVPEQQVQPDGDTEPTEAGR
jgi:hypothetical protein